MDYRLVDDVTLYLKQRGLDERYSEVRIAGGGLAAVDQNNPHWVRTVWENVALSRQLHGIRYLLVINHQDCGAFAHRFGRNAVANPNDEFQLNVRVCTDVVAEAARREPTLTVECAFMGLDGVVRRIDLGPSPAGAPRPAAAPVADQRAAFAERVRARVAAQPLDREQEMELLRAGIVEHGLTADDAAAALRGAVAGADARLGREAEAAVETFLEARAGTRKRVSQTDFESAARLFRAARETVVDQDTARRSVKAVMERRGYYPKRLWWPPFSRAWYDRI
ncbi:MAG: hypothetical protein FJX60_21910 [Alphaproteobacteria bacterium]|nr:hypothetical protein [Alphaproteobacteria bacterium]